MDKKEDKIPRLVFTCACGETIELNPNNFKLDHPACEVRAMDWNKVDSELEDRGWSVNEEIRCCPSCGGDESETD